MRSLPALALAVLLAGCGDSEPRPSDAELGKLMWEGSEVGGAVRPYEDCLQRSARETRPATDLGLERIEAVLAACGDDERALTAAVRKTWSAETEEQLEGREKGIRGEALRVIKETPYDPPSVTISD